LNNTRSCRLTRKTSCVTTDSASPKPWRLHQQQPDAESDPQRITNDGEKKCKKDGEFVVNGENRFDSEADGRIGDTNDDREDDDYELQVCEDDVGDVEMSESRETKPEPFLKDDSVDDSMEKTCPEKIKLEQQMAETDDNTEDAKEGDCRNENMEVGLSPLDLTVKTRSPSTDSNTSAADRVDDQQTMLDDTRSCSPATSGGAVSKQEHADDNETALKNADSTGGKRLDNVLSVDTACHQEESVTAQRSGQPGSAAAGWCWRRSSLSAVQLVRGHPCWFASVRISSRLQIFPTRHFGIPLAVASVEQRRRCYDDESACRRLERRASLRCTTPTPGRLADAPRCLPSVYRRGRDRVSTVTRAATAARRSRVPPT
jgi:hypothetical protein